MADRRSSSAGTTRLARLLSGLVFMGGYEFALLGSPISPGHIGASLGGAYLGSALPVIVWSLIVLTLGCRFGVEPKLISLGLGPALRTSFSGSRILVVRRFPVPVLRTQVAVGPTGTTKARLVALVLVTLTVQGLVGLGLLLTPGPFGVAAGVVCLGTALVRLVGLRGILRVGAVGRSAESRNQQNHGDGDREFQVLAALQRSVAEARRLIEDCPDPEWRGSAAGRQAELPVLMGEGRYREVVTVAEGLAQEPGVSAVERAAAQLSCARALAYAMEAASAEPGDRERFLGLCRELRDMPAQLSSGSDLRSLYYLVTGDTELAVDEARAATRVGSAPRRRSMAYCTLAMALTRAGRSEHAQKALRRAMSQGSDTARIAFVAGVLMPDGQSTPVSQVGG